DARFVVTSRPPAVAHNWLKRAGFAELELQPMLPEDVYTFVDLWHAAAQSELASPDELLEIGHCREKIRQTLRDNPSIRTLATSPLLCAMLCALNRDRHTQLPRGRMELYQVALETLIHRRDIEREIPSGPIADLGATDKQLLLQDIAYWMLQNNKTDVEVEEIRQRLARKIRCMPKGRATPQDVLRDFHFRMGLVRQPLVDHVDFIHRTFQEFLGAKEAVDEGDVGVLIDNAHLDQWREVVILAAGHAQKKQRKQLIRGLLRRGNKQRDKRHRFHL